MLAHQPLSPTPSELIGEARRFGEAGPTYLITGVSEEIADGEPLLEILVPTTGETALLRYAHVLQDPPER